MLRTLTITAALAGALLAGTAAARPVTLPLLTPTLQLQYGGILRLHAGANVFYATYLDTSLAGCQAQIQAGYAYYNLAGNYPEYHQPCQQRSFFGLVADDTGDGDTVTVTLHLPAAYVRGVGKLRDAYRIDEYERKLEALGAE